MSDIVEWLRYRICNLFHRGRAVQTRGQWRCEKCGLPVNPWK